MLLYNSRCAGPVLLVASHIGRGLTCANGMFSNPHGAALYIEEPAALFIQELTVGATMYLQQAQFIGQVFLSGVQIGGLLGCEETVFLNPGGHALVVDRLTGAAVSLRRAKFIGEVKLSGVHVGGLLDCFESTFINPAGTALDANRLTVDGDISLTKAHCSGEVLLPHARINGQLDCSESTFIKAAR
jgi:hypothetical protein